MQRAFFVVIHMLRIMEYFFDGAGLRLFPTSRLLILAFSYVVPMCRPLDGAELGTVGYRTRGHDWGDLAFS